MAFPVENARESSFIISIFIVVVNPTTYIERTENYLFSNHYNVNAGL